MKKVLYIILFFILYGQSAISQDAMTLIENNIQFTDGANNLTFTLYHERGFKKEGSWGYTDYIYLDDNWAEILHGFYYMPGNVMFALYGGLETDGMKFRPGAYIMWNMLDNLTLNLFGEYGQGDDNYWYDTSLKWIAKDVDTYALFVQPRARRGHGIGLPIGYTKKNIFGSDGIEGSLTLAPFYNYEEETNPWNLTIFMAVEF